MGHEKTNKKNQVSSPKKEQGTSSSQPQEKKVIRDTKQLAIHTSQLKNHEGSTRQTGEFRSNRSTLENVNKDFYGTNISPTQDSSWRGNSPEERDIETAEDTRSDSRETTRTNRGSRGEASFYSVNNR